MNEAVLRINNIPIFGFGILAVFTFLWGSFVFYKRASKSNFEDKLILDIVVLLAFWGFIVGRIVYAILNTSVFWNHWSRLLLLTNFPGIDRFGVIAGMVLGLWFSLRKSKGKFLDWFDLVSLGVTSGVAVFYAGLSIMAFKWSFLVMAFLYLIAFIYFWNIEERYRKINWYRNNKTSAKSGFITGFSIALWGVLYVLENLLARGLSWRMGFWAGMLLVGGLILVYIRSGRTYGKK